MSYIENKLKKVSSAGRIGGSVAGAMLGGLIPAIAMKKELANAKTKEEKINIRKKYLSKILLTGGAGSLAGGLIGATLGNKHLREAHAKNPDGSDVRLHPDFYKKNLSKNLLLGGAIGAVPGAYEYAVAKNDEEKERAKKRFLLGTTLGGAIASQHSIFKHLEKGLSV